MTSARTAQGVSGAIQGAVTGSAFGPIGSISGAILGGLFGSSSGASEDRQREIQREWEQYNSLLEYQTNLYNIQSRTDLTAVNVQSILAASNISENIINANTEYNAAIIGLTTLYNHSLQTQQLERIWDALDLDLSQIENFRSAERGSIVAQQGASGTVIGEGSNEDVIVSQKAQEALDKNVVQFNADVQAADINNEMARGLWQGEVALLQNEWEGQLAIYETKTNAAISAGSTIATNQIQSDADLYSARQRRSASQTNISHRDTAYNASNRQNLITGIFSGASRAVSTYYQNKPVKTKSAGTSLATGG